MDNINNGGTWSPNKITIYTTPSCGWCRKAKDYFKSEGLAYTEYNVATDIEHRDEMIKLSGQMGVPVITINGKVIVGYDKEAIDNALVH